MMKFGSQLHAVTCFFFFNLGCFLMLTQGQTLVFQLSFCSAVINVNH